MNQHEFAKLLASKAPTLFSELLQSETRTRQRTLMILSVVTILLFGGAIVVAEGQYFGIKLTPVKGVHLGWVAWSATIYALLAFGLACYHDTRIHHYTTLEGVEETAKHFEALMQDELLYKEEGIDLLSRARDLLNERTERANAAHDAYSAAERAYEEAHEEMLLKGRMVDFEAWKQQNPAPEHVDDPEVAIIDQKLAQMVRESDGVRDERKVGMGQVIALEALLKRTMQLKKYRLWLDVAFPVVLALFALFYPFLPW